MIGSDREEKIKNLVIELNAKGKGIPTCLAQITELPINDFREIIDGVKTGNVRVLRFSITGDSDFFPVLATDSDKFNSNIGLLIMIGGPVVAMILSYFYSWWLLLSAPIIFYIGCKVFKNAINRAIFKAAFSSELIFCFLYFARQISVELPKVNAHFYHKD